MSETIERESEGERERERERYGRNKCNRIKTYSYLCQR